MLVDVTDVEELVVEEVVGVELVVEVVDWVVAIEVLEVDDVVDWEVEVVETEVEEVVEVDD
jgi:hypothetical protein